MVALFVSGEENQVRVISRRPLGLLSCVSGAKRHIGLEPQNRTQAGRFGLLIEKPAGMQVSVIRNRQAVHAEALDVRDKIGDPISAVQQRKFRVGVQVREAHARAQSPASAPKCIKVADDDSVKYVKLLYFNVLRVCGRGG